MASAVRCWIAAVGLAVSIAPAAAQQPQAEPTKVDASGGGVTFSSGANSLSIGARAQFRWTVDQREKADADTVGAGVGRADGAFSQFDVTRMRLALAGGVYRPWMRYTFQFELGRTGGEGASKIKDASLEIRPTGRNYRIAVGQFKTPFGLQQQTSQGRQQFVDRAITDAKFNPGRDVGLMFAGTAVGRTLGYEVGVFNGSGESARDTSRSHLWVGRFFFNPLGVYALSEGASDPPDRPVVHFGAAARGGPQIRGRMPAGIVQDADNQTAYGIELAFKARRFSSTAEHFWMIDEQQNPAAGPDLKSRGYHAQAGLMLVPRLFDAALRYAAVDPDTSASDAALTELLGVVGYYWRGHNLKVQADAGRIRYGANFAALSSRARAGLPALGTRLVSGRSMSDKQFRLQCQVTF